MGKIAMKWMLLLMGLVILWAPSPAGALTQEELMKRLDELSVTIQKQQQEIERLKQELKQQKQSVDSIKENQEEHIQKAVNKETEKAVKAETQKAEASWREWVPEWVRKIRISGDLRLRYERIWDRHMLNEDGSDAKQEARDRGRIRARLFFDADITDEIATHFMICTNMDSHQEATTTNQTFTADFNDKGIYLHRAYATYDPKWLDGLSVGAGKFKKNFYHTDIMWDPDVNPEGAFEAYRFRGSDIFQPFIYLSQMVVNENNTAPDAMLYITQIGYDWKIGPVDWALAGSYYSWSNLNDSKWLHRGEYKKGGGNTFVTDPAGDIVYKYQYKLLEAVSFLKFKAWQVPVRLEFDYVLNTADGVPSDQDTGVYTAIHIGQDKKKGDLSFYYKYAYIEQNAVVGSLNDQDFYGANRKGHKVAVKYVPFNRTIVRLAFFYTDPVSRWRKAGNPLWDGDRYKMHEDRLQMDFIFKF